MDQMEINPDVFFYTVLIDGVKKTENFHKALSLFGNMVDSGLEPDTVTCTALGLRSKFHREKAIELLNKMGMTAAACHLSSKTWSTPNREELHEELDDRSIARKDDRPQTNGIPLKPQEIKKYLRSRHRYFKSTPKIFSKTKHGCFPHNHLIDCRENRSCVLEGEEIINLAGKIELISTGTDSAVPFRIAKSVVLSKSSTLLVASCHSTVDLALDTVGRDDNRTARSGLCIVRQTVRTNLCRVVRSSIRHDSETENCADARMVLIRMAWMRMNRKSTGHDAQGGHRVCKIKSSILGFCESFIDKEKSKSSAKITPTWVIILGQNQRLYEALEKNFEDSAKHVGRLNLTLKKNFLENISCGNVTAMRRKIGSFCGYGREPPGYSSPTLPVEGRKNQETSPTGLSRWEETLWMAVLGKIWRAKSLENNIEMETAHTNTLRHSDQKMTPVAGRPREVCSGRSQENDFRKPRPTQEVRKMTPASGRPGEMCSGRSQENDSCLRTTGGDVFGEKSQENDSCLRMTGGDVFGEKKMIPALGRLGEVCSGRSQENDFRKLRPMQMIGEVCSGRSQENDFRKPHPTQEVRKMTPASR
ncbi:hypothetical protein V8G54_003293 [Vigna mungo]|uniref:Pentatricopeptide repeat-containing protein n=1 Tax=Vigna mungo TaxID=3915 RepID=A0AAQ3PC35_VIGMU